ncbi:hypothetical protein KYB31_17715 [Clostridium felsineum]|uniref:hypothetical protein n=1 Tax=Clostridium felsineum TaxID=36839 RepID=UPI00214D1E6F|nr:hypothetical protein [Clostridium felsineum]MCR3760812.1 hypothetical protein [Clostridium felsineum]
MALARIASLPGTTLFKNSGGADTPYLPNNTVVALDNPYSGWANINPSTTPTIGDLDLPKYLWYLPSTSPFLIQSGEIAYFYRRCTLTFPTPLTTETIINISMQAVADNACMANVYILPYIETTPDPDYPYTETFYFGKFNQAESFFETSPYTWQSINSKAFSISNTTSIPIPSIKNWSSIIIELEGAIMNYAASPIGNPLNPAGFQYNIEFDNLPEDTVFTNTNNQNPANPLK